MTAEIKMRCEPELLSHLKELAAKRREKYTTLSRRVLWEFVDKEKASLPPELDPVNCVGNKKEDTLDIPDPDGVTLREKYQIGDPVASAGGSSTQLRSMGYVGIYLREPSNTYGKKRNQR